MAFFRMMGWQKRRVSSSGLCNNAYSGTRLSQIGNVTAFSSGLWKRGRWWQEAQRVPRLEGSKMAGDDGPRRELREAGW